MRADPFTAFADELSHNLPLVVALLADHAEAGHCTGCRAASSRPPIMAPCGPRSVAVLALRIRAEAETADATDTAPLPILTTAVTR